MRTEVVGWGDSLAVRLPKQVLEQAELCEGVAVEVVVESGTVILRPAKPRYGLNGLIAGMTPENLPESFDDAPVGREWR